ncbi:hypothetical protein CTEN210_18007 [Chaetoceros tenuissimus]|uniref:Uncharacterized protein n=1 Tax=Chaetoceros tenuissimus TaxID=426638 RepID=A0AAD3HFM4_9STRA|nr:hypothetical protein CTEN210_18007 [Chaetoceros tenuissimus]
MAFTSTYTKSTSPSSTKLFSLKPAAVPLMDAGKALARSGELLIDATSNPKLDIYGGGLSSTGANIRNSGDCIAQAAASCRFKTAAELVSDELRESATCFLECVENHLLKAIDDAQVDEMLDLKHILEKEVLPSMTNYSTYMEQAGAGIVKRETVADIGKNFYESGKELEILALAIQKIDTEMEETKVSGQRMLYASEMMKLAGNNLMGVAPEKKKGKGWLKG